MANTTDKKISGSKAFELYDTFGFPLDLTALIGRERGFQVDEAGFAAEMEKQKARSRAAAASSSDDWQVLLQDQVEEFVGYDLLETEVKITRFRKVTSKKEGDMYQLVFTHTPFYPEGGGQVGDKGYLEDSNGDIHYITDTKKENDLILHFCKTLPKNTNRSFKAVVDANQRSRTSCNHTATHLMHQALRTILGDHVEQKGSMVHSGMFRFDFSHFTKVTTEELAQVEQFVNARIQEELPLEESRNIPKEEAVKQGALALFGEKYGDTVRAIRFGQSIELCGGTHVANTSQIWHFKITGESAVAAGIRRIEAITADAVKTYFEEQNNKLNAIQELLNRPQDTVNSVQQLQIENTQLKKEVAELNKLKTQIVKKELEAELKEKEGLQFLAKEVSLDAQGIKNAAFDMGQNKDNLVLILAAVSNNKPILSCYISKKLVKDRGLNAGEIVRSLGKHIRGGGGGQAFFATAGGSYPEGINAALGAAEFEVFSN